MSKPSWDDAPKWAKWLAMDDDGSWAFYENGPYFFEITGEWLVDDGQFKRASTEDDTTGSGWRYAPDTLESKP